MHHLFFVLFRTECKANTANVKRMQRSAHNPAALTRCTPMTLRKRERSRQTKWDDTINVRFTLFTLLSLGHHTHAHTHTATIQPPSMCFSMCSVYMFSFSVHASERSIVRCAQNLWCEEILYGRESVRHQFSFIGCGDCTMFGKLASRCSFTLHSINTKTFE